MKVAEIVASLKDAEKELRRAFDNKHFGLAQMQWERLGRLRHLLTLKQTDKKQKKDADKALVLLDIRMKDLRKLANKISI